MDALPIDLIWMLHKYADAVCKTERATAAHDFRQTAVTLQRFSIARLKRQACRIEVNEAILELANRPDVDQTECDRSACGQENCFLCLPPDDPYLNRG